MASTEEPPSDDAIVEESDGWGELTLPADVYSCAFVLASNSTDAMYSFSPLRNRQMWLLWFYLTFISFSQTFALTALTVIAPPPARSNTIIVDCGKPDAAQFIAAAAHFGFSDSKGCTDALDEVAFAVDLGERELEFRYAKIDTLFFDNTLQGDFALVVLQLLCCSWVITHLYFRDFNRVEQLLHYRDFNLWFLPVKGEQLKANSWVLLIPLLQWALATLVVAVSWCLISGYDDPVDVVLNSMAFTFITEVAETFAEPVLNHYAEEAIAGLDPAEYGSWDTFYIVTEYDPANATETGWYVKHGEAKAGLITDFRMRVHPELYPRHHLPFVQMLRIQFFTIPPASLLLCYLKTIGAIDDISPYVIALFCGAATVTAAGLYACETHPDLDDGWAAKQHAALRVVPASKKTPAPAQHG